MRYHPKPAWLIPDRHATPESLWLNRRQIVAGMGLAGLTQPLPALSFTRPEESRSKT